MQSRGKKRNRTYRKHGILLPVPVGGVDVCCPSDPKVSSTHLSRRCPSGSSLGSASVQLGEDRDGSGAWRHSPVGAATKFGPRWISSRGFSDASFRSGLLPPFDFLGWLCVGACSPVAVDIAVFFVDNWGWLR